MKPLAFAAIAALAATAAAPVLAQDIAGQGMPPAAPAAPASPVATRVQLRTMESVFTNAVQGGVTKLAEQITQAFPGLTIVGSAPRAHGYTVDNYGWFFDVEVPELQWAVIELYAEIQPRPNDPRVAVNGRRPASGAGAVASSPAPDPAASRDEYRRLIREALMDAMLDFGQVPLKPNERLTVGARSADSPLPTIDNGDSVSLVMQISGEDLALFRQLKITREEAKQRIRVREDRR